MIKIIKVTGSSLSPFFLPGDYVIVAARKKSRSNLKAGEFVVFDHPDYGTLIKIIKENNSQDEYLLVQGANTDSISSHKLGPIPYQSIRGKVIFSVKQPRVSPQN